MPWQGRGWTLAPRARGREAGMYCWTWHRLGEYRNAGRTGYLHGMRLTVCIALVLLAAACGGGQEHAAPRPPDRVVLANEDGRWTVYTRCVPGVVGPGYVARVETTDGQVLVDDTVGAGTLNDSDYGGLGAFGWHHARGRPGSLRFTRSNSWEISTRGCASASRGFGVTASRVLERTSKSLAVEVD